MHYGRDRHFLIQINDFFLDKPLYNLPSLKGHFTEGIAGIDINNIERESVDFVVRNACGHKNFHSTLKFLARNTQEFRTYVAVISCPYRRPHLCCHYIFLLFYKVDIAVPGIMMETDLRYFRDYPVLVEKFRLDGCFDEM